MRLISADKLLEYINKIIKRDSHRRDVTDRLDELLVRSCVVQVLTDIVDYIGKMEEEYVATFKEGAVIQEVPDKNAIVIYFDTKEEMSRCAEMLKDVYDFKWHNLRENPEDLPEGDNNIRVIVRNELLEDFQLLGAQTLRERGREHIVEWRYDTNHEKERKIRERNKKDIEKLQACNC